MRDDCARDDHTRQTRGDHTRTTITLAAITRRPSRDRDLRASVRQLRFGSGSVTRRSHTDHPLDIFWNQPQRFTPFALDTPICDLLKAPKR